MKTRDNHWSPSTDLLERIYLDARQNALLIMDVEGYILDVSETFTMYFGYYKEDIIGKHSRILFTEEDQGKNLPERELIAVQQTGAALDTNFLVSKNKTAIWVSGESFLVKDKENNRLIVKIIQNIHNQKELEYFLLKSNHLIESILHNIQDIIIVLDSGLKVLKANEAFMKLFSITHKNIEGSMLSDLIHANNYNVLGDIVSETSEIDTTIEREVELETSGTKKGAFVIRANLIEYHFPAQHAVLLTMYDITQEKLMEQQRENMIGFVAHELRNPLANLFLFTDLLREEYDTDVKTEYLSKMNSNLQRLNNIVRDLYDTTRAETGQLQMTASDFPLGNMIEEAIDTVKMIYPSHRIINEGRLSVYIKADKHRLVQVLTNYLINAIKYSPGAESVVVRSWIEADKVIVSVTDFGRGIPSENLSYVFMRYYRTEKITEGVGLGLYLSREIIKAHQGEVWAESAEGKGSTFYFSIPL